MVERVFFTCHECEACIPLGPLFFGCPKCAEEGRLVPLEVDYAYNEILPALKKKLSRRGCRSIYEHAPLLPVRDPARAVSLGEGNTPLLPSVIIGPALGLKRLYFKNETQNPTWSYKDRLNSVSISVARELGFERVVTSSTGNHGASTAAYAARAGIQCVVFCPPEASALQRRHISSYGARVFVSPWNEHGPLVEHLVRERGYFPATSLAPEPVHNPFAPEGYKTLAYEMTEQLDGAPDLVLQPTAGGNGLFGIWKGFGEQAAMGRGHKLPRMVACQPAGANALEQSFAQGLGSVIRLENPTGMAISTREPTSSPLALHALYESHGVAVSADDDAIREAMRRLAAEGICAESSSALPVACLPKLVEQGQINPNDTVICVITSAGIKWPGDLDQVSEPAVELAPDIESLERALESNPE